MVNEKRRLQLVATSEVLREYLEHAKHYELPISFDGLTNYMDEQITLLEKQAE